MLRGWWNSAGFPNDADVIPPLSAQKDTLDGQTMRCNGNIVAINLHSIRYAPHGKRSWGPTRALIGEATTQQANDYVKVGKKKTSKAWLDVMAG